MIKIENVVTPSPEQWKTLILGARYVRNAYLSSCLRKSLGDLKHGLLFFLF